MSPLNLKDITLDNLNRVTVVPSETNVDRGYGRRFKVMLGTDEQVVVFKDLYKTARRLKNDAENGTSKQLDDVNGFIHKLEDAENQARSIYKDRGYWYKFRSWFHRFFGGAFLGSHLDRLGKLQRTLASNAVEAFSNRWANNFNAYCKPFSERMEILSDDKKFLVEWTGIDLRIWDEAKPDQVTTCTEYNGMIACDNVEGLEDCTTFIFRTISDRLASIKKDNEQKREALIDLCKQNPHDIVFKEPVVIDGKSYIVKTSERMFSGFTVSINEEGDNGDVAQLVLSKTETKYENVSTVNIPEKFEPLIKAISEGILERIEERKQGEIAAFLQNSDNFPEIFDNREKLIALFQLIREELAINMDSLDVDLGKITFDVELNHLRFTSYATTKNGANLGLLEIDGDNEIIYEGERKDFIPDEMKPLFKRVLFEVYTRSSSYSKNDGVLKIDIAREGLDVIPEWHLHKFCDLSCSDLQVRYRGEEGSDQGGLKREYVEKLSSNISKRLPLFAEAEGSLKVPRIAGHSDNFLCCDSKEQEVYQDLGTLISMCYHSRPSRGHHEDNLITTGRLFSDMLFKAAFTLSEDELHIPLEQKKDAQIRMAIAILTHFDDEGKDVIKRMIDCFKLCEANTLDQALGDPARSNEVWYAFFILPESVQNEYAIGLDPDFEKIKTVQDQFKADLLIALMSDSDTIDDLNGNSIGSMLDPIYHVAKGMRARMRDWDRIRKGPVHAFSSKVQGAIHRDKIIASIISPQPSNTVLDQKVIWLKEWINEASDSEIQAFLKFATGSSSLIGGAKLKIDAGTDSPFISASTCNMTIHISDKRRYPLWKENTWDNTKEAFFGNLKSSISVEGFQMS